MSQSRHALTHHNGSEYVFWISKDSAQVSFFEPCGECIAKKDYTIDEARTLWGTLIRAGFFVV